MLDDLIAEYRSGHHDMVVAMHEAGMGFAGPSSPAAFLMVAQSYLKLGRPAEAAPLFVTAGRMTKPQLLPPFELAFSLYANLGDVAGALGITADILRLDPRHKAARKFRRRYLQYTLSFDEIAAENRQALAALKAGDMAARQAELPWDNVCWCPDEAINSLIPSEHGVSFTPESRAARRALPMTRTGDRIRIAYLSNDFSTYHATMVLFRAALEAHDLGRFELRLFCYTSDALASIDEGFRAPRSDIVSIGDFDDDAACQLIRAWQPDILIDLKGHTHNARVGLVNLGLAPVQVAYLGFPGSAVGIDCDYIIGDPIVTPDSARPFYHEKFCRLPECYQPNDNVYRPRSLPARRADVGLPDGVPVFASFNAARKISPEIFAAWMRIMRGVPNSVLWIMCEEKTAKANILSYAARAGVARERLIFARKVGQNLHIARLQAATLALDTWPCNGHTTSSDALWAGLPLLTIKGGNFASRVSESLLHALDLDCLVADDRESYVQQAITLARDPARLSAIREKLVHNKTVGPLFDTVRYVRHLERGYEMMMQRARAGLEPDHLDVTAEYPINRSWVMVPGSALTYLYPNMSKDNHCGKGPS